MGYSILILEDNKTDASLMEQYLKRSKVDVDEIIIAHNKEDYLNALRDRSLDLIISDYRLPDINGTEAIKLKDKRVINTPIVIVSATIGEEKAVELIRDGASDFLIKDNIKSRLAQVAERAIRESEEKLKRVQAEQDLKLSENKYSLLFESSLDGIIIGIPNDEGKVVDVNPSICCMLGYTRDEMIGLKRSDIVPEQSEKKILEDRKRRGTFNGEMLLKTKEGQLISVETTSRIVELESGEKRSFSIIRDIRKRKEAEQRIRKQQDLQLLQKDIAQILNENKPYEESIQECLVKINEYLGWDLGHLYIKEVSDSSNLLTSSEIYAYQDYSKVSEFLDDTLNKTFSPGEGFIGEVAKTKAPKRINTSNKQNGYHRLHALEKNNLNSGILLPIVVNGETEAVLEFYTHKQKKIDKYTQEVLEAITNQVALLIERKYNHETLLEEKEKFELLAENSTDMISRHDEAGIYLYVSPACEEIMGFRPDELIGSSAYEYFHPDDLEDIERSHTTIMESPDTFTIDYRIKQKDGTWKWVETTSKTLRDSNTDEVTEIVTVTRDISDRKKYELELQRQIRLNDRIINSLPGIFFVISEDGIVRRVNEKLKSTIGYDPDVESKKYSEFISEPDLDRAIESFQEAFEKGYTEVELNIVTKNGSTIPFLITAVVDELTDEYYLIGAGIDISERVKAETKLKEEIAFSDTALNSLPGLFYVLDEEQNYVRVNDNFTSALGYSREELEDMNPLDFYLDEDKDRIVSAIQKAFEDGSTEVISRIVTKEGKLPYYYLTGSYFSRENKNYILGTGIDITEQIRLETMLEQAQDMAHIGAWELDLINDQLIWSKQTKEIHEVGEDYQPSLEKALEFYPEDGSRDRITKAVKDAIHSGKHQDIELQIITAKNNCKWIRSYIRTEFSAGECIRVYGSFQDITDQKIKEDKIIEGFNEREILLQEIHHRVKNNLALVSGMLQLQAFSVDNEEVINVLSDSQSRIKSIALLHEQLYKNESFSKIEIKQNFKGIIDHLKHSIIKQDDISIALHCDKILLNINQAIPLSLLLNELLTNSIKHAFKEDQNNKQIDVTVIKEDSKIRLQVQDNGSGLADDINLSTGSSLGFTLVNTLTAQLSGNLEHKNTLNGVTFTLTFNINEDVKGASSNLI